MGIFFFIPAPEDSGRNYRTDKTPQIGNLPPGGRAILPEPEEVFL